MPRILFIAPTSSPIGGLQTWLDELCAGLTTQGWEPIVGLVLGAVTHDAIGYQRAHPKLNSFIIDGRALTQAARVRAVMWAIRKVKPDFYIPLTVIDAHDAVCALKIEQKFNGKYILSLHGNLPEQIADARLFQGFADASVNPGALTSRLATWVGMEPSRVFHVPNGASVQTMRNISNDPDARIRLAYVGRLSQADKRVGDLIPLVEYLEKRQINYQLDVVGEGPHLGILTEKIKTERVKFCGFIKPEELHRDYFPHWDGVLMFSQSEAFGISLVEAMMHGVVPVSSRFVGHAAEGFLRDQETALLFDIGDMQACANCIERLARDRQLLRKIAVTAYEWVVNRYTWKQCVEGWEQALTEIQSMPLRATPMALPRKLDEGNSLASRFPKLPKCLSDGYYRSKNRLLGVPKSMHGGEEWSLHTRCFAEDELKAIEAVAIEMDALPDMNLSHRFSRMKHG